MEVESIIQRTVKEQLPILLKNQLKEQLLPLLLSKVKGVDKQVNEEVLPYIEKMIVAMM